MRGSGWPAMGIGGPSALADDIQKMDTRGNSMNLKLEVVLACGFLALAYGAWTIRLVLSRSAGNERMQEIAAAIQEWSSAFLPRQYTTIRMPGIASLFL